MCGGVGGGGGGRVYDACFKVSCWDIHAHKCAHGNAKFDREIL